jgi:DNA-binding CsgD family transcriptional regulator
MAAMALSYQFSVQLLDQPISAITIEGPFQRVSALQIEDQAWPKKCGHEPGREIVPIAEMVGRIKAAVDEHLDAENAKTNRTVIDARLATLTPREHEVLNIVANGETNKVIADELGISEKTVEFHRANIMQKLAARSLADLIRATRDRR